MPRAVLQAVWGPASWSQHRRLIWKHNSFGQAGHLLSPTTKGSGPGEGEEPRWPGEGGSAQGSAGSWGQRGPPGCRACGAGVPMRPLDAWPLQREVLQGKVEGRPWHQTAEWPQALGQVLGGLTSSVKWGPSPGSLQGRQEWLIFCRAGSQPPPHPSAVPGCPMTPATLATGQPDPAGLRLIDPLPPGPPRPPQMLPAPQGLIRASTEPCSPFN